MTYLARSVGEKVMSDDQVHQPENSLAISHPMPALRLNQREVGLEVLPLEGSEGRAAPEASGFRPVSAWWIRPLRGMTGLLLLALAWVGLLAIVILFRGAIQLPVKFWPLSLRPVLPVVELVAALWIGVTVAMSILVGSFLLWLALTVRGW